MPARHILSIADLDANEIQQIIDQAIKWRKQSPTHAPLQGKRVALLFERPSMRTRVGFEIAVQELGGVLVTLSKEDAGIGQRESAQDVARVLGSLVHVLVVRTGDQVTLEELAHNAGIPVVNALTRVEHPCDILADLGTIQEVRGNLRGQTVAFFGDGNNVATSLALGCALLGAHFRIACPPGFKIPLAAWHRALNLAEQSNAQLMITHDPAEAARNADVLYTDQWPHPTGTDSPTIRHTTFSPYQVNAKLLALAHKDAIVMHVLPVHRGEEIMPDIMDGPQSRVTQQVTNRLHTYKAILSFLTQPSYPG